MCSVFVEKRPRHWSTAHLGRHNPSVDSIGVTMRVRSQCATADSSACRRTATDIARVENGHLRIAVLGINFAL
jgi:hypothetical protein